MSLIKNVYAVSTEVTNPLPEGRFETIGNIAGFAINVILGIGWALTFVMLALGFIKYILSRGETKATDQAREWLTYAALGGVGLFFLTVIRSILTGLLGAERGTPTDDGNFFDPFNGDNNTD